jgi:membrane protein implicated in regulation of membrane protease activity
MLYWGAVLIEGLVLWLLATGASGWHIVLTAVLGVILLLAIDAALEGRSSKGARPST